MEAEMADKDPTTKDPKPGTKNPDPDGAGGKPAAAPEPLVYETWIDGQPDEVKTLLTENTTGLKTALASERDGRKILEGEIRDMAKKADGDQKVALEGMADKIESADQKTVFYEDAHAAGMTNLKLGYQAALADEMFDRKGNVNFDTMKTEYPELFSGKGKGTPKGGAGDGHNNDHKTPFDMNARIRQASGRNG